MQFGRMSFESLEIREANPMALIRVPYPSDPERRRAAYELILRRVGRYGKFEGTADEGTFHGRTPIGSFAGAYSSPVGSEELVIELHKKPWLISVSRIEHEARRFLASV